MAWAEVRQQGSSTPGVNAEVIIQTTCADTDHMLVPGGKRGHECVCPDGKTWSWLKEARGLLLKHKESSLLQNTEIRCCGISNFTYVEGQRHDRSGWLQITNKWFTMCPEKQQQKNVSLLTLL